MLGKSVKSITRKILVAGIALSAVTVSLQSLAGGPVYDDGGPGGYGDRYYYPQRSQVDRGTYRPNLYLGLNLGAAFVNFKKWDPNSPPIDIFTRGNVNFTAGLDVGYMVTAHLGIEAGFNWIMQTELRRIASSNDTGTLRPWQAYLAAKVEARLYGLMHIFVKGGIGYYKVVASGVPAGDLLFQNNASRIGAFFAGGTDFMIGEHMAVDVQFATVAGVRASDKNLPWADLITAGFTYKFHIG